MNSASEKILKERADELSENNKLQLSAILNPLHENIKQMREAVEKSDRQQNESMTRLDQSIKENLKQAREVGDRKSTRLNSSHANISYAVFCLKKKITNAQCFTHGPYRTPPA